MDTTLEMEEVLRLRYRIYIEELGKTLPAADHVGKRLPDPDDVHATHFAVRHRGDAIAGCVRLHLGTSIPINFLVSMGVADTVKRDGYRCGFVSKLMVDRTLRGRGASLSLMSRMIEYGAARGGHYALFHCNPKLVPLYEKLGFLRCGVPFDMPHVGLQIPLINLFGDVDHFVRLRSPLAEVSRRFKQPRERIDELRAAFHCGPC